jgi:hypothetical protein
MNGLRTNRKIKLQLICQPGEVAAQRGQTRQDTLAMGFPPGICGRPGADTTRRVGRRAVAGHTQQLLPKPLLIRQA